MANGDEGRTEERPRLTQNGPRLVVQAVLAALAILVVLWLANIITQYDDDPVLPGLAEAASQNAWIGICLVLLALFLIVEVLLLLPAMAQRLPEPLSAVFFEEEELYMMGCSGCGTVFDIRENDLGHGKFECPNCGRTGEVKSREEHVEHNIEWDTCKECGTRYQKFRDVAECPNCHLSQD